MICDECHWVCRLAKIFSKNTRMKNAVHKRLDELTAVWEQFTARNELKLFRFLVDEDNNNLVEAFISYHQEEGSGLADLFLRFDDDFQLPGNYGNILSKSLTETYQDPEFQELLNEGGSTSPWEPPTLRRQETNFVNFVSTLRSLQEHHGPDMDNLVIILTPKSVADPDVWENWLLNLVRITVPSQIRYVVIDSHKQPTLDRMADELNNQVFTHHPELDITKILQDLAKEGDASDPGVQFRQCFIAISAAAGEKDEARIQEEAKIALGIVEEKEWHPLKVTLYMVLGAAYLGMEKPSEAIHHYNKAKAAALQSEERGDPEGRQLVAHTVMAKASALISSDDYAGAADIYCENADQIADQPISNDEAIQLGTLMENQRMAAYCYSVEKEFERSWEWGVKALETGKKIDNESREESTLKYVGLGLLELVKFTKGKENKELKEWVSKNMEDLLGPNWESIT